MSKVIGAIIGAIIGAAIPNLTLAFIVGEYAVFEWPLFVRAGVLAITIFATGIGYFIGYVSSLEDR